LKGEGNLFQIEKYSPKNEKDPLGKILLEDFSVEDLSERKVFQVKEACGMKKCFFKRGNRRLNVLSCTYF